MIASAQAAARRERDVPLDSLEALDRARQRAAVLDVRHKRRLRVRRVREQRSSLTGRAPQRAIEQQMRRRCRRRSTTHTRRAATKEATRKAVKRELINTGTDMRFVRRGAAVRFKESDYVGKSLTADRRKKAKTKAKPGRGDKGDR